MGLVSDVWVQMVSAGFGSNGGGWVRLWVPMDGLAVGGFWWVFDETQVGASS